MTVPTHCEVNKPEIIQEIAFEETEDTIEILCSNTNSNKDQGFSSCMSWIQTLFR